jgi:hypothetical protein
MFPPSLSNVRVIALVGSLGFRNLANATVEFCWIRSLDAVYESSLQFARGVVVIGFSNQIKQIDG